MKRRVEADAKSMSATATRAIPLRQTPLELLPEFSDTRDEPNGPELLPVGRDTGNTR